MAQGTRCGDILNKLYELAVHDTKIFPASSELACVLTAHATADVWSAWAEIVDDTAVTPVTLSASFAACDGHVTGMITESANQDSTIYMVEAAFGSAKTIISRWRVASHISLVSSSGQSTARGEHIPEGETVYYRMKCATAGSKTLNVHFRHFCHD